MESCVSTYNGNHGMAAFDGGIIRVSHSTATNNTQFGFRNDGTGTFESRENSTVRGNGLGNTTARSRRSRNVAHEHEPRREERGRTGPRPARARTMWLVSSPFSPWEKSLGMRESARAKP